MIRIRCPSLLHDMWLRKRLSNHTKISIKTESHLQSATSRKIHPDNRTARGTLYRLRYNRGQSNITERWKKWRTFDWWRRRTRIDVDVDEYEGVARPHPSGFRRNISWFHDPSQGYQVPHKSGNSVRCGSDDVIQSYGNAAPAASRYHPRFSLARGEKPPPEIGVQPIIIVNYHASVARFGR